MSNADTKAKEIDLTFIEEQFYKREKEIIDGFRKIVYAACDEKIALNILNYLAKATSVFTQSLIRNLTWALDITDIDVLSAELEKFTNELIKTQQDCMFHQIEYFKDKYFSSKTEK